MNTDNMSILGLTLDYGPFGWIEDFDPDWTPNTTDAHGRRYRFGAQPEVAYWNTIRLAQALAPLFDGPAPLEEGLRRYRLAWQQAERDLVARKLGLAAADAVDVALYGDLCRLLHAGQLDMTLSFRALGRLDPAAPDLAMLEPACYDAAARGRIEAPLRNGWCATRPAWPPIRWMRPRGGNACAWPTPATCRATGCCWRPSSARSRATWAACRR